MAWRVSASLRNAMLKHGSLKHIMSNMVLKVYTGAQPTTADAAPTGTLLCTYSNSSGALTREVRAQGKVTFSGTVAAATCTGITVNSLEIMGSTFTDSTGVLADFATGVAAIINNNPKNQLYDAVPAAGVVTLTARPGLGDTVNGHAVVSSVTTITKADVNIGSLTAGITCVNGLQWGDAAAGILQKHPTQIWSGLVTGVGTQSAGWFRLEAAVTDAGGADASEAIRRLDGLVATSAAELNMASVSFVNGATKTISDFAVTFPTS